MDAPRDDLIRFAPFEQRASIDEDGRTLTGYPIVFDQWTTINSYEGQFQERIAPGAVNRTIKNNRDSIKVLFNHGMDPDIGDKPLGRATVMRTDARGLYVEVPMSETSYNADLLALIRDGALDGMSFRFSVPEGRDEWEYPKKGLPRRTINELSLYEFGPVTFPAYKATTVGIRSRQRFADWLGLDDEKRAEIARLTGISFDLRTLDDEPAEGTSSDGLATEDLPDSPVQHSGRAQLDPLLVRAKRLKLRELI